MKELTGRRNLLSNHKMKPQGVNDMKEKRKAVFDKYFNYVELNKLYAHEVIYQEFLQVIS